MSSSSSIPPHLPRSPNQLNRGAHIRENHKGDLILSLTGADAKPTASEEEYYPVRSLVDKALTHSPLLKQGGSNGETV